MAKKRKRLAVACEVLLVSIVFALMLLGVAKAISLGVTCADDAYFASIAKNVASGVGYGTTVSGEGFVLFDPAIGTGPAVLLPAALAIVLVGNEHWIPG